jgi:hypothetical protein
MAEDTQLELINYSNPSHRLFQGYPMGRWYLSRRGRKKLKKSMLETGEPSMLDDPVEQPTQGNSERSAKRREYNAKKAQTN